MWIIAFKSYIELIRKGIQIYLLINKMIFHHPRWTSHIILLGNCQWALGKQGICLTLRVKTSRCTCVCMHVCMFIIYPFSCLRKTKITAVDKYFRHFIMFLYSFELELWLVEPKHESLDKTSEFMNLTNRGSRANIYSLY